MTAVLRKTLVIAVAVGVVATIVRALRGGPAPAFDVPAEETVAVAAEVGDIAPASALAPALDRAGRAWIEGSADPALDSHPVKAKLASGIYHLPGMMNYNRVRPDRWYRTAAEAEADGLRREALKRRSGAGVSRLC